MFSLQFGNMLTETGMNATTEPQMTSDVPCNVEPIRILKFTRITVGGRIADHNFMVCLDSQPPYSVSDVAIRKIVCNGDKRRIASSKARTPKLGSSRNNAY